ncbi:MULTISPECIES: RNA recognition motif domain-containing protein [Endozoicomonas]|uniref:Cold-inducible RNA-binding protein n=3 Tax=Endozoicomonas TaxID=305899 RepID=A0ABV2SLW5_9GAMM|nr:MULTISPECIES: RNA-binding protein [Endozoicomonas]MCW7553459.1 RNA-binding protein [Endozoicomonas gorgoniicola]UYM16743.1 RNA-binding protein [Endozoicomonas euniceicola]
MQQKNKLFIGNLAFSATEQELEEAFGAFGEIQEAKIILDRETGRSRGFAFVTFASDADANEALALDGQNLSGRDMRVSVATERPRRQGGGNREGGRRF